MKRICLIAPGLLPVPATQGGAIETLMTSIVNQNELYKKLDLTVVTTFDDESKGLAESMRSTKFVLIPPTTA
ncbi:glycosyltransferase family 1 protein, partial [Bifidobacterium longum subsp. longum]